MTKIVHVKTEVTIKAEIARVESVYVPSGGIRRIVQVSIFIALLVLMKNFELHLYCNIVGRSRKLFRRTLLLISILCLFSSIANAINCQSLLSLSPNKTWLEYYSATNRSLNSPLYQLQFTDYISRLDKYEQGVALTAIDNLGLIINEGAEVKITDVFSNYNRVLLESVKAHNLKFPEDLIDIEKDTLRPGVLFYKSEDGLINSKTEWFIIDLDGEIPSGFKPYDFIPTPTSESPTLPPGKALYEALAKGYFPVSILSPEVAAHDIMGHLINYSIFISYSRAYRRIAERLVSTANQNLLLGSDRPWSFFYRSGLFGRIYSVNESIVLADETVILDRAEELGFSKHFLSANDQLSFQVTYPNKTEYPSSRSVVELFNNVRGVTLAAMTPMGGSTLVDTGPHYKNNSQHNTLLFLLSHGDSIVQRITDRKPTTDADEEILRAIIGWIRGHLVNMSHYDIELIVADVFQDIPDKTSNLVFFWSEQAGYYTQLLEIFKHFYKLTPEESERLTEAYNETYNPNRFGVENWDRPLPLERVRAR